MIIGVSGKIGSGKDEVGKIIQYLAAKKKFGDYYKESYDDFTQLNKQDQWSDSDFKIKKYADKLKDIVCLLIGCTREQLEDREFKEKKLGDEWTCWEIEGYNYENYLFNTKEEALESQGGYYPPVKRSLTPRLILQLLGTEAGREIIHPNIWVNALMSGYKPLYVGGIDIDGKSIEMQDKFPNWIITDMRFPNELEAVKSKKGITIRIDRPETDYLAGNHVSETALDNVELKYRIVNDGTIENLIEKVADILKLEDII